MGRALPLHLDLLLAAQDGAGPANGFHAQIQTVLVLADQVQDAAQGDRGVLVDGGPQGGGGRLSLAECSLHDDCHAFAIGRWLHGRRLHAHHLAVYQPIERNCRPSG